MNTNVDNGPANAARHATLRASLEILLKVFINGYCLLLSSYIRLPYIPVPTVIGWNEVGARACIADLVPGVCVQRGLPVISQ